MISSRIDVNVNESSISAGPRMFTSDDTEDLDKLVKDFRLRENKLEEDLRSKDELIRQL